MQIYSANSIVVYANIVISLGAKTAIGRIRSSRVRVKILLSAVDVLYSCKNIGM